MPVLNQEQTEEIINGAIEKIREAVISEATRQATYTVQYKVKEVVDETVGKFMREEVAPEIVTSLKAQKDAIFKAMFS